MVRHEAGSPWRLGVSALAVPCSAMRAGGGDRVPELNSATGVRTVTIINGQQHGGLGAARRGLSEPATAQKAAVSGRDLWR